MAIELISKIKPKNGTAAMVDAVDVEMPDGSRLDAYLLDSTKSLEEADAALLAAMSEALVEADEAFAALTAADANLTTRTDALEKQLDELSVSYPMEEAKTDILPERYYTFGEVDHLEVNLIEVDDDKAHEYYFEFIPTEDFTELTVTPTPKWAREPQYPAGKTCQVSVLRGIGVMVNA